MDIYHQGMTISGTIKGKQGDGVPGVMVMTKDLARGIVKTVFSDSKGQYRMPELFPGKYQITAKRIGFNTAEKKDLEVDESGFSGLTLELSSTSDIGDQLPSSTWMALLPPGEIKRKFVLGCTGCHQFGDSITRRPCSKEEWIETIRRMKEMSLGNIIQIGYAVIPDIDEDTLAGWLVENGFGEKSPPAKFTPPPPVTGEAAQVVITEYDVGDRDTWLHDMTIDKDGYAWAVDYAHDAIFKADPTSGKITKYELPVKASGPHTIHPDRNNILWITLELGDMVVSFDRRRVPGHDGYVLILATDYGYRSSPIVKIAMFDYKTETFNEYDLPNASDYTYSLRVDGTRDIVWVCGTGSDSLYKFDPETEQFIEYQLPSRVAFTRQLALDYKTGDVWTSYSNWPMNSAPISKVSWSG